MGKGLTGIRSLQREHCPDAEGRVNKANLTAGNSKDADAKRLRKRGCLKSPVRENRTPGSVLGLLGN
jgi:hypothetical protein